jgi:dolichol-phosphate mannosyltransferase
LRNTSHQGFVDVDVIPYDIVHSRLPAFAVHAVQSIAFIFEHAPVIRELCGTLYLWARKPGESRRPDVDLAVHPQFEGAVWFIVPCYNEEMNVGPLVNAILKHYRRYVHEILIVNENSKDRTAEVTREITLREPCVKLVDRKPPNGVGRALRDGYRVASGRYIRTMDSDFVQIIPELRDLFQAVANGYDGAIGSRFTHESIMLNYPFLKILCNRVFHILVRLLLRCSVRDISNNLKLYRTEIIKEIKIGRDHFAANAETGLKPVMSGSGFRKSPFRGSIALLKWDLHRFAFLELDLTIFWRYETYLDRAVAWPQREMLRRDERLFAFEPIID